MVTLLTIKSSIHTDNSYRPVSNIRFFLVGNKFLITQMLLEQRRCCYNYIFILDLTPGFNGWVFLTTAWRDEKHLSFGICCVFYITTFTVYVVPLRVPLFASHVGSFKSHHHLLNVQLPEVIEHVTCAVYMTSDVRHTNSQKLDVSRLVFQLYLLGRYNPLVLFIHRRNAISDTYHRTYM